MQENVSFAAGHVNGTLKYIENWTQFSADTRYNTGNFVAFKVTSEEDGAVLSAGLEPKIDPSRPDFVTDPDGEFIFQISDKEAQVIRIKTEVDGVESVIEFDCVNLTLESE